MARWRNLALIVTLVVFHGCATQTLYVRPGATAQDFERDRYECQNQAIATSHNFGATQNIFIIRQEMARCLRLRYGWVEQDKVGAVGIGLNGNDPTSKPLIINLAPSGPSELAGLKVGDLIVSVAGKEVSTVRDAGLQLFGETDTTVEVVAERDGTRNTYRLTRVPQANIIHANQ